MQLNQLADQLGAKTIQLIAITKALNFADLPSPHGGTSLMPERSHQVAAVYRYMRDRQIAEPAAAIAQMQVADSISTEEIVVSLRASVADELCHRYQDGSMSDRILRLLGALQSFEQLHAPRSLISEVRPHV